MKYDMRYVNMIILFLITMFYLFFFPEIVFSSVESTLSAIQSKFIGNILPLMAVIGLILAGMSFVIGSPNARSNLILAIIGAIVGFGAPSIVNFIRSLVH